MERRQKPPMAAWIQGHRRRLGWSKEQLSAWLIERGFEGAASTIGVWEGYRGLAPRDETVNALETLFGEKAPRDVPSSESDLAAAIRRQADAIEALVSEMRAERAKPPAWADALMRALGVRLTGSGTEGSNGPQGSDAPPRGQAV